MKTNTKRGLFCLDWSAATDVSMFGTRDSGDYGSLSIIVMPCNMRLTYLGASNDRIDSECVADLNA